MFERIKLAIKVLLGHDINQGNNYAAINNIGKGTVQINGVVHKGNNVSIDGRGVLIDGVRNDNLSKAQHIDISLVGDCDKIELGSGTIHITGNVKKDVSAMSGTVHCQEINGSVSTMSGDVICNKIHGSVDTMSGDIIRN